MIICLLFYDTLNIIPGTFFIQNTHRHTHTEKLQSGMNSILTMFKSKKRNK